MKRKDCKSGPRVLPVRNYGISQATSLITRCLDLSSTRLTSVLIESYFKMRWTNMPPDSISEISDSWFSETRRLILISNLFVVFRVTAWLQKSKNLPNQWVYNYKSSDSSQSIKEPKATGDRSGVERAPRNDTTKLKMSSYLCVFASDVVARRIAWTSCRRTSSCIKMAFLLKNTNTAKIQTLIKVQNRTKQHWSYKQWGFH